MLGGHSPAWLGRQLIGRERWAELFTFTIERNPWDRLVSQYFFNPHGLDLPDFSTWLHAIRPDKLSHLHLYHEDGEGLLVDHVMQYGRGVQQEVAEVLGRLGVTPDRVAVLPRAKGGYRPTASRDYRTMYTDEDAAYVAEGCAREIALFGYSFEGSSPDGCAT